MFNNTQPQAMPYLTRLNGYQQDKEKAANNSLLPINQPGGNTDTQLPVAKEKEDPMKDIEQSSFYQNHQRFMQNDPEYASQFNEFASTAAALHKEVKNGTMPQPIAEKRLQEAVLNAQQGASANARQAQQQQQQMQAQQQQQPQGALMTPINQMQMGAGDVPTSSAQDAATMAAAQQGQQPQQAAPQPNPQEQAQMQQQAQDQQTQAVNTQQTQANTLSKGSIEDLADIMKTSGLVREGDDAQSVASMYYNTKGYTNEDVDKAAAMLFSDQHAAQASETPKGVAPQFAVSDGQINATAARNANISQGIGDYKGNVEAPEQPTPSQQLNQSLDQASNEVTAQVNEIPNWYESKAFGYSLMRFGLGLLGGEDMVGALKGASMSYMDLDGMEKRERWRGDLQKEGYNNAQIEAYIQTGNSNLLKKDKPIKDTWVNLGQGMKMNQATGEVEKVEGWEKQQNLRYFQEGNSGEYIGYDPNTGQQVRTGVVGRLPTTGQGATKFQWVGDPNDPHKEILKQYDPTIGQFVETGETRARGSTALSEGERVRQAVANAPDDQYLGARGPNSFATEERQKIGYLQQSYTGSMSYVRDVMNGTIKPAELNTLSTNLIESIVMNPDSWLSGAIINSATKEQQPALNRLKQIIDPIARARSGAAIGKEEMANYLGYLKEIHRQDAVGATARVNMLNTIASLAPGSRKDLDFMQNNVFPRARDARPLKDGTWGIGYLDKDNKPQVFKFKPGRFFVN